VYCFDLTDVDYSINKDLNVADDHRIEEEARKVTEQHNRNLDTNTKQKTLFDMWAWLANGQPRRRRV
jgi:hypothetical protein